MVARLWEGLNAIDLVKVYGPPPDSPRTSTLSFTVSGYTSDDVARRLADKGIFASDGDFYALRVLERLGLSGVVRAGCACYTTDEEVERLVEGIRWLTA